MKRLILLGLIFGCSLSNAQIGQTIREYHVPLSKFNVGLDASYILNSTSVNVRLANQIISSGYIGNDLKDRVFNNIRELPSSIGGDANVGGYFVVSPDSLFKRKGVSWFAAFNHKFHVDALLPRDAFGLAAYGNARYEGQTANISGLEYNLLSYQQFQAGLMFNNGKSGAGLSLLKGHMQQSFEIPNGKIFTAPNGESIDLELVMNARQTDREKRDFQHVNGAGVSVDFFTYFNFGLVDSLKHKLLFEVKDLGFIHWNKNATAYKIDSSYHFDGFAIDNLLTLSDSIIGPNISDSSLMANATTSKRAYTTVLPAFFHIADIYQIHRDLKLMSGLMYRIAADYNVYFYVRGIYQWNPYLEVSARIAWGGYGLLNAGTAVNLRIKQKYHVTLGTENIEGWILPKYARGSSAFIGLQRRF